MKDDSGACWGWQDSNGDRGAAMKTCSSAGDSGTNCLLVRQRGSACKSNVVYQLTASGEALYVAK
jgi:hypothetical protein